MAGTPGTFRFPEVNAKPAAPPAGYALIYVKTDNVLYLQDSSGTEIPLGSASSITQLTGEVTAVGPGSAVATISNAAVIGKVLTGFTAGPNSTVLSTDTILQAFQKLQGQFNATVGTAITSLTGDVSGTGPGATATTVNTVGGKSAASIATSVNDTQAATNANTPSTIVKRDASGNFSAGTITATLSGTATNFSGSLSGDVTGTQSATVVSTVGGKSASAVATSVSDTQAATSGNTPSTIVKRDGSGNFSAGTITANLTGNVSGSSTTFTGNLVGDVTGTQSATVVSTVGGKTFNEVAVSVNDTQAATSSNTASTIVKRDASGNFAAGTITAALSGNATTATTATNFSGSLSGDVTGTQSATVVATVGGKSASAIATSVNDTQAATSTNTASTIVKRDASGNFAANVITASLTGNATTSTSFTGPLVGDVTGTQGATVVSTVGGSTAANVHSAELAANAATSSNTASTIVKRDASGNFSASTITANLTGNASGSAASFTGTLSGDVTGTQSATAISNATVTGKLITGFSSAPGTVTATDSILTAIDKLDGNINASVGSAITALTGDVVATGPGSATSTIQANVVSNSKLAQMPANTIKGNNTGATANAADLTKAQVATMFQGTPVTQLPDQSNASGSASTFALSDHVHNIPSGAPVQIGTSNVQGSAASFSLSDHIHSHGNQTVGTLHAAATTSVNGFMSSTDKTKLDIFTSLPGSTGQVLISNGTNISPQTVSSDATITNTGALTISTGAVTDTKSSLATKPAVTVVATTNQALTGTPTIDGQATTAGTSMVLLTAQTTGAQNGPWIVQTGAWTRPTWYPSGGTTQAFQFITTLVRLGTTYQGSVWRQTTAAPITIDTTATTWVVTPLALNSNTVTGTVPNANTTGVSTNTPSTLVLRDGSGNFAAGTITANLTGNASGSAGSFTGNLVGDVTGTQGATVVSTVGGKTASAVATSVNDTQAATALNTASTIVKRDASGNFATSRVDATALGVNDTSGTSATYLKTSAVGTPTLTLKAITSQTGDLMQILDSSGSPQMIFASGGNFKFFHNTSIPESRFDLRPSVNTLTSSTGASARYSMFVGDPTNPQASGQGGGIALGAVQDSSSTATEMGLIWVTKNNSTSGNIDSSMHFATRNNTSGNAQRVLDMDQNGNSTFSGNIAQNGSTSGTFTQQVPTTITSYSVIWPNAQGAANSFLKNDGSGNLSWTTQGNGMFAQTTKSANYTILSTDTIIFCDTSSAAFTLTLPSPTTLAGKIFKIIDSTGSFATNNLTLARSASEKIEGLAASKVFQTAWGGWTVTTNGTDWFIL